MRLLPRLIRRLFERADGSDAEVERAEQLLVRELLSDRQLEEHARNLAGWHRVAWQPGADTLLGRLAENARIIRDVYDQLAASSAVDGRIPAAGEWLLDNTYLVEEQIRLARRHLPRSYSRKLPRLSVGPCAGDPRVYALAMEYIAHVDGRIEPHSLTGFIAAYQEQATLTLGELWALPIVARLALVENLRRVCVHIHATVTEQGLAERWGTRLLNEHERNPRDLILVVADMARSDVRLSPTFVAEIVRRLSGQKSGVALALTWLEDRMHAAGSSIEQQVARSRQNQATDQMSVAATIGSLRVLDAGDWPSFVENQAEVERSLRRDPADAHARMDFTTRDRYRHEVERLAQESGRSEVAVAERAVDLARSGSGRQRHVGWWLIGDGRQQLAKALGLSWWSGLSLHRGLLAAPLLGYLAGAALIALLLLATLSAGLPSSPPPWAFVGVAVLGLLAVSSPALAIQQGLLALWVPPRAIPRMDFSAGIPAASRAVVAVPCLLTDQPGIDRLVAAMEVRYLSNRDPQLSFVLLSDFRDAASSESPGDATLIEYTRACVDALSRRHPQAAFSWLHRPRIEAPAQGVWMGRERKRGKLADLNRLLLSGDSSAFSVVEGDLEGLRGIRSVIVLDADTQLPPKAAAQLVGCLAHPLNRPSIDPRRRIVVEGHGLIQPRVAVSLPSATASAYADLSAGQSGIDPYTRAVSDTYQDLFDEGSFIGKGIYDLQTYEAVLADRFPDDRILSHDLLEGCYLRCGLDSETLLLEDGPARYLADSARRHRWIRGDWQIARWLLPRPPTRHGRETNPLSALSRWKIADNLRRSLASVAWLTLWLLAAVLASSPLPALLLLAVWLSPALVRGTREALLGPGTLGLGAWVSAQAGDLSRALLERLLDLVVLPHQIFVGSDAMLRSAIGLARGRGLLAWSTSADADLAAAACVSDVTRQMWAGPLVAMLLVATAASGQGSLPAVGLLAGSWLASGPLCWALSRPRASRRATLHPTRRRWFRRLARQTYAYFEDHCVPSENFLPPDNVHLEDGRVAHRTSPTNIGIALLAHLGARDLGHCSLHQLLERVSGTVDSAKRLERYRGHFLNWYDTQTLKPLAPRYVSTVDSGNLVGHCRVLRQGLFELGDAPVWTSTLVDGLAETWELTEAALGETGSGRARTERDEIGAAMAVIAAEPERASIEGLARLDGSVQRLNDRLGPGEAEGWPARFASQVAALRADVEVLLSGLAVEGQELPADITPRAIAALRQTLVATLPPGAQRDAVAGAAQAADALLQTTEALARQVGELACADFAFLLHPQRNLLVIGHHVDDDRPDMACYDLLASEARLASYLAVAQGQVDLDHWFHLGRLVVDSGEGRALVSWSGSMFEYLMPDLVMPNPAGTLLGQTNGAVVKRQLAYGRARGVPWGISESGYNRVDQHLNYQYRAFGVPGLGLERGLAADLVIAPYACLLALPLAPEAVWLNLRALLAEGAGCVYGLAEAIDYTPLRLPPGQRRAVVLQVMVHHLGMAQLAMVDVLVGSPMQRRFLADPELRAVELLLHERVPRGTNVSEPHPDAGTPAGIPPPDAAPLRVVTDPTRRDEVALLSNGRYHVQVGVGGGGWSRWRELAVTRWREDPTLDDYGTFILLHDRDRGRTWSVTHQPVSASDEGGVEAIFSQSKAEFRRRYAEIDSHLEIAVSPEDDVEVRRLTLHNRSLRARNIDITTYAEVVIAPQAADCAHPGFSNLFVQTEALAERGILLATRRPRSAAELPHWLLHLTTAHGVSGAVSWTTDRAAFLGRGRSSADAFALASSAELDGATGAVLDPIVAIRRTMRVPPGGSVVIDVVLGVATTREDALALAGRYADQRICDRVFDLAWTHAQVAMHQLGINEDTAQQYARLAGAIIHPTSHHRAPSSLLARNTRGQRGLWGHGISGDLPIVLVSIERLEELELARSALLAHDWWRSKGLSIDLVIMVDDHSVYRQALAEAVNGLVGTLGEDETGGDSGTVFVRRADQMSEPDREMFQALARVVLTGRDGSFDEQVGRRPRQLERIPRLAPDPASAARSNDRTSVEAPLAQRDDLVCRNRWGGFTRDGREYVLVLVAGEAPPQPWVNVIANPFFGTVVSESGAGYTWLENSHEFRLTPWHGDPVLDRTGEAFYLRDADDGRVWSPCPGPVGGHGNWVVRHGFGYTAFEHNEDHIASELWTYVATDAPVRFWTVTLRNHDRVTRRISVCGYVEWVLGELRAKTAEHIVSAREVQSGALTAQNAHHSELGSRIAFFDCSEPDRSCTADRAEFVGIGGSLADPAGLKRERLSNRSGAGLDPCAALLTTVTLTPGQERQVSFVLGVGTDAKDVQVLIQRFRGTGKARHALERVWEHWNRVLGRVKIQTPDPAVDHLVNGWLGYQTLSCRVWARTGFSQSGGAYGFRDQLQDVMALVHLAPEVVREHLLRAAAHQFTQGDVQHWWHPPSGRGVRTRFSDDLLWLPLAVARYVDVLGDRSVLDQVVPFLEGRAVAADEEAYFDQPMVSEERATLFEHGARSIDLACTRVGPHGLPTIGCGDWNDGMNRVGEQGRGESVWLAFFSWHVIQEFAPLARARGQHERADRWTQHAASIIEAVEREAWDGAWYRRASMDDGRWLGSAAADECQIDALPQSWAVLTGAGDPARARKALDAVERRLVRYDDRLIQLFDPPFDEGSFEPGYIKGYLPGVRENGGQYTHAALWTVMAAARLGDADRAWRLFDLINPVTHADTAARAAVYRVEPYVIAADVYAVEPHVGRGGWTWYTGSAGWCHRLLVEELLGLRRIGDRLFLRPLMRPEWPGFTVDYTMGEATVYHIVVTRQGPGDRVASTTLDGQLITDDGIPLYDDRQRHQVDLCIGG